MIALTSHVTQNDAADQMLLDVQLITGNVPLDGFAVELLFHNDEIEITDVYVSGEFTEKGMHVAKKVDNTHGLLTLLFSCDSPIVAGEAGKIVALLAVKAHHFVKSPFLIGDSTRLFIHG